MALRLRTGSPGWLADRIAAEPSEAGIQLVDRFAVGAKSRRTREAAGESRKLHRAFPAILADRRHAKEPIIEDDVLQHHRIGIPRALHVLPLRRGGFAPPRVVAGRARRG